MKIELKNISKKYGNKSLFSDINKVFNSEKIYVIKGVSGSGKSTLLNVLSSIARADSGELFVNNECINTEIKKNIYRNKAGFIYQNSFMLEDLTLEENLMFSKNFNREILIEKASLLNLSNCLKKTAGVLSIGERQRANLLRALMKNPEIIFADEPCASLDSENADIILSILENFVIKNKKTLFYVGHEQEKIFNNYELINLEAGAVHFSF